MKTADNLYTIAGIGSPVVDQVVQVSEEFVAGIRGKKGGMELVDEQEFFEILRKLPSAPLSSPGGSAGNTTFALARLGVASRYIGVIGDDEPGNYYRDAFAGLGGDVSRFQVRQKMATAQCLSLVTPDGERTMRTHLGAAATLAIEDITTEDFTGCNHVHIEGYLLFNQELMSHVLTVAKQAGCTTSVDLASFEVVHAAGNQLPFLLEKYVDMVFANEEEAEAFSGSADPDTCLNHLGSYCDLSAVKFGADGALIRKGEKIYRVEAIPVSEVVDTTGAGDMWAAGFLYGLRAGRDIAQCGRFGSVLGATVVQQQGTTIPEQYWNKMLKKLEG